MDYDFKALHQRALLCAAVYEPDDDKLRQSLEGLACEVVATYSTATAKAALVRLERKSVCVIAGTLVSEGSLHTRIENIREDAQEFFANHDLGDGAVAGSGPYESAQEIWTWLAPLVGTEPVEFIGHSLGGGRAACMMGIVPEAQYASGLSLEGTKPFNNVAWARFADLRKRFVHVVNGLDPWAAHPIESDLQWTPEPILWLPNGGGYSVITRDQWPGEPGGPVQFAVAVALRGGDHDINRVATALARLVA